jgi:hypothetical protein
VYADKRVYCNMITDMVRKLFYWSRIMVMIERGCIVVGLRYGREELNYSRLLDMVKRG